MDKIKKYKQFKELDYDDIKERFGNAIDEVGGDSYSRIYREYRDNADLEDELYTELIKNGLDDEILKKHLQKLAADFSDENGIVDLFFYTLRLMIQHPTQGRRNAHGPMHHQYHAYLENGSYLIPAPVTL